MSHINVDIPYQEKHSRMSVLLRPILALPIILVMSLIIVPNFSLHLVNVGAGLLAFLGEFVRALLFEGKIIAYTYQSVDAVSVIAGGSAFAWLTNTLSSVGVYGYVAALMGYLLMIPIAGFGFWFMYVVNFAVVLTLLFRGKYPDWWFQWNQALQSFVLRIYCYSLFLTDRYPSLEARDGDIRLVLPHPEQQNLSRLLPIVKWLLVLPYLLVYLVFLAIGLLLVPITFLAILVTGRLPRVIYNIQTAIIRFYVRIAAYALLLVTDKYPKMIFRD